MAPKYVAFFACLALAVATQACDDDKSGDDDDGSAGTGGSTSSGTGGASSGTGGASSGTGGSTGTATVSGTVGRELGTCPPNQDGIGTLCLSLRASCEDPATEVAGTEIPNADMSFPTNTIPFEITDVPDGSHQLFAILDDDMTGCDYASGGDFELGLGCVPVTVTDGADVTGVTITFDSKCPP